MPRLDRLTALEVSRKTAPGRYCDGGGLYLQITPSGVKSWLFRYTRDGKARGMGLGPLHTVSLKEARQKAVECRRLCLEGLDPLDARAAAEASARAAEQKAMTFRECAEAYIAAKEKGWSNPKHRKQWRNTLASYVYPVLGALPVQTIDTGLVSKVLEPIWHEKSETAGRIRGRIESVLDWAAARGFREGDNPARWRGHMENLLSERSRNVAHHSALPYREVGEFVSALRSRDAMAALALEFLILTACRTGEVLGARWDEINLEQRAWVIPASRMKAKKEHRVPLSARALAVLREVEPLKRKDGLVFPGARLGKPLSNMALLVLLRRMKRGDVTAHGFRSTFRDWAAEQTAFPREVIEKALAHAVANKVEASYWRGDLFEKRRPLMDEWAKYCEPRGQVVPFAARGGQ